MNESTKNNPSALSSTREKIQAYRKIHGRKTLPIELMEEVIEHSKYFSLSHVAKALGLNYNNLKKMGLKSPGSVQARKKREDKKKKPSKFVQLPALNASVSKRVQVQMKSLRGQVEIQAQSLAAEEWESIFTGWLKAEQTMERSL
jgi:hypothetical protein